MKKYLFLIITIVLVITSCRYKGDDVVDVKAQIDQIKTLLEQYVTANQDQNFSLIENIWSSSEDIILIGTDLDERLTGWTQIQKAINQQFKSFEDTYISVSDQIIRLNKTGNTAWFSLVMNYNFIYNKEAVSFSGIRFTGVIDKIEGKWLFVQGHLSIPAEAQLKEVI
jgi:hypothetical protein